MVRVCLSGMSVSPVQAGIYLIHPGAQNRVRCTDVYKNSYTLEFSHFLTFMQSHTVAAVPHSHILTCACEHTQALQTLVVSPAWAPTPLRQSHPKTV